MTTAQPPAGESVDIVIAKYADHLTGIYRERTAGDHTFTGVLAQFAHEFAAKARFVERLERAEALHEHTFLDEFMLLTEDMSRAVYGRCDTCGNIPNGYLWCPTVIALRGE